MDNDDRTVTRTKIPTGRIRDQIKRRREGEEQNRTEQNKTHLPTAPTMMSSKRFNEPLFTTIPIFRLESSMLRW